MLSIATATEKKNNYEYLLKIIPSICFLGRQGLPLRGDGPHNDLDSNFYQLLLLRAEDFQGINVFIEKKQMKYTSHEIQNESLSIMSLQVICEIASQILSAPYFTVMIDEATDLANIEQVVLVIRSVNDNLTVLKISLVYIKLTLLNLLHLLVLSNMSYFG